MYMSVLPDLRKYVYSLNDQENAAEAAVKQR